MQRDEAKAILELCRPGSTDDREDPLIAEALGLLETDAELRAWFDEQQALDARIAEGYNQIKAPDELKAGILAGMRAHRLRSEVEAGEAAIVSGSHDKMDQPTASRAWWRKPWIGIAAVFALLFVIVVIPANNSRTQLASSDASALQAGVPAMIQFLASEIDSMKRDPRSFEKRSDQPETLQAYLASAGAHSPANLPSSVRSKRSLGCFTLDYKGIKMGMICFKEDEVLHLITAPKTACSKQITEEPTTYEMNGQAFKAWIEGEQVYIISVEGSKEKLPKFI
jgi:hypothetical protein